MKSKNQYPEICPLCGNKYTEKNQRTGHHIFPKYWYKGLGPKLYACFNCHTGEFHHLYLMDLENPWSKITCVFNWVEFCSIKGKNAFELYPQLKNIELFP